MARGAAAPWLLLCGVWRAQAEAEGPAVGGREVRSTPPKGLILILCFLKPYWSHPKASTAASR